MKVLFTAGLIIACITSAELPSFAQMEPPPPPPPGQPGRPGPPPQGRPGLERPLQQLKTLSGTLTGYLSNERYEYDGFTLQNSGQTVTVRFPAHIGESLMRAVRKGGSVTLQGFYETSPEGANEFHLVSADAGNVTVTDSPPAPPAMPVVEEQKNFSGTISDLRKNREGLVDGILIGGELIELTPASSEQLQTLLKPGERVAGLGTKVTPPPGVVMVRDMIKVRPQTLTINGQTYLIR